MSIRGRAQDYSELFEFTIEAFVSGGFRLRYSLLRRLPSQPHWCRRFVRATLYTNHRGQTKVAASSVSFCAFSFPSPP